VWFEFDLTRLPTASGPIHAGEGVSVETRRA
jgi:hypothetical protein